MTGSDGVVVKQERKRTIVATELLYCCIIKNRAHVVLTRQFRMPTYINGNETGLLIECCAGLLDEDNPEECIRRETMEETGYQVTAVEKVFEAYMSPGSVTEILYFCGCIHQRAESSRWRRTGSRTGKYRSAGTAVCPGNGHDPHRGNQGWEKQSCCCNMRRFITCAAKRKNSAGISYPPIPLCFHLSSARPGSFAPLIHGLYQW